MKTTKGERLVAMEWGREWLLMMAFGFSILFMGLLWLAAHPWDEEGGPTLQEIISMPARQAGITAVSGLAAPSRRIGDFKTFESAGVVPPLIKAESERTAAGERFLSADDSVYSSGEVDERPELIWMLCPDLSAGESGGDILDEVVLNLIVNHKGEVEEAGPAGDMHGGNGSVRAALAAVKEAVFKPARRDNNNVRCRVELRVRISEG